MKDASLEAANLLLETESVLFNFNEPFQLTSGKKSPVYVDCRRLISFAKARSALMDQAATVIREKIGLDSVDFIAGGETAGIPYAAFLAEKLGKPMLYIRKKPKGFGRMAQIEGCFEATKTKNEKPSVLLVEDLQTDGGSKQVFVDALREAGADIKDALVVFHYGIFSQSEENMRRMGLSLHALATWHDILAAARTSGRFDRPTLEKLEAFIQAPESWQAAQGQTSHAG